MQSKVVVTADKSGNVIGVSQNNPEYGYIRVEQKTVAFGTGGWARAQVRSALIKGPVEVLKSLNLKAGSSLPGKIVVKESFEPFNPQNPNKHYKYAGETGVICRVDDQPIYRDTEYTEDMSQEDVLIKHTNTDEIREARNAANEVSKLVNNVNLG